MPPPLRTCCNPASVAVMPKGVVRLANAPAEELRGRKIGAWYFMGAELRPPHSYRPQDHGEHGWAPRQDLDVTVRITLARGPGFTPQSDARPTQWARLDVCFAPDATHPSSVTLIGEGVNLGPEMLRRFPWKTWLTVADAAFRQAFNAPTQSADINSLFTPSGADGSNLRRRVNRRAQAPTRSRPGRAGHDDTFYLGVAERYRELLMQGSTKPTQCIADEAVVSRSTAAGWVRTARVKGFLKPGRRGRPG